MASDGARAAGSGCWSSCRVTSIRGRAGLPRRQMRAWEHLCGKTAAIRQSPRMVVPIFRIGEGGGYAEANLSAQEAQAQANARLYGASVNQERTADPEAAPQEGAQAIERGEAPGEEAELERGIATCL